MNIDERIALWKSLPPAPVDETDGFIEMLIAERDGLKQAVNTQTDLYRKGLVEIDRLEAELEYFQKKAAERCENAINLESQLSVAKEALAECEGQEKEYGKIQ